MIIRSPKLLALLFLAVSTDLVFATERAKDTTGASNTSHQQQSSQPIYAVIDLGIVAGDLDGCGIPTAVTNRMDVLFGQGRNVGGQFYGHGSDFPNTFVWRPSGLDFELAGDTSISELYDVYAYDMNNNGNVVGAIVYYVGDNEVDTDIAASWTLGQQSPTQYEDLTNGSVFFNKVSTVSSNGIIGGIHSMIYDFDPWIYGTPSQQESGYIGNILNGWESKIDDHSYRIYIYGYAYNEGSSHCSPRYKNEKTGRRRSPIQINKYGDFICATYEHTLLAPDEIEDTDPSEHCPAPETKLYDFKGDYYHELHQGGTFRKYENSILIGLNDNSTVLGWNANGGLWLEQSKRIYLGYDHQPSDFSNPKPNEPLVIVTNQGDLLVQQLDPETGALIPVDEGKFITYSIDELINPIDSNGEPPESPTWDDFIALAVSDNGKLIAANAIKQSTGELHSVLLVQVDVEVPQVQWSASSYTNEFTNQIPSSLIAQYGAFVPLNSDDDDYSGIADKDDTNVNGELAKIEGPNNIIAETDLLEIKIGKMEYPLAYVLDIPSGVRLWRNKNRSNRILGVDDQYGPTYLDFSSDLVLYVEGVELGEHTIEMEFAVNSGSEIKHELLKINVFDIEGPTSVPARGTYLYRISGHVGGEWPEPENGKIKEPEDGAPENEREMLWDSVQLGNGAVGAVLYEPIPGMVWGREIDIVSIRFDQVSSGGENEVRTKNLGTGWSDMGIDWDKLPHGMSGHADPPDDSEPGILRTANSPNLLRAWIEVLSIRGASRAGIDHRGVDRLNWGFVQTGKWITKRSIYPNNVSRISELEGMDFHLDCNLQEPPFIVDMDYPPPVNGLDTLRRSLLAPETNKDYSFNDFVFHYEFERGETLDSPIPGVMVTDQFRQHGNLALKVQAEAHYNLYVCVVTRSGDEEADHRFYKIAHLPQNWRFGAYGTVTSQGRYNPDALYPEMQGAYANSSIVPVEPQSQLFKVEEFGDPNEYLIHQEYPPSGNHENWN